MAHIAINISKPYTFDKIMSASELMLYTNISNYLVDGVDMNTILSALAEFTDDAIFHPVKINQENNMFQEWNGVNYVDTVKATGQNIEVEIGDNKIISSFEYGPGEWIIQDVQTNDGNVRGLEWKNIYPSVDRFYKDENEEWQPIDNDDYHENVKYVFHSLQPRGIKRIKIENGDFTDGNSIDLYKSFDSENQGDHLSVNLESKKETFALHRESFIINKIEGGQISKYSVPSVVSLSPRCDVAPLNYNDNVIYADIKDENVESFLLATTDDEYVDYPDYASINFGGEFKGGVMSFSGIIESQIQGISFDVSYNGRQGVVEIDNLNTFGNIVCLYSRNSSLTKDVGYVFDEYTSIRFKTPSLDRIKNPSIEIRWDDNNEITTAQLFISDESLKINWDPTTIKYTLMLGVKINNIEASVSNIEFNSGNVTLVPTNINTFGRMREYAIPESVTTEYAVHSIEGGGRNYNPEAMAWLNSTSWYKGNPNYMTFEEAAAVDSEQFSGTNNAQKKAIVTFDEAQYFTSVTYLTSTAFQECNYLRRITLPDTLTEIQGSDGGNGGAFSGCTDLVDVYIPDSVTTIGRCAFDNCGSLILTSLPSGITSIGQNAFHRCESLALTSLPSGLTSIESGAFSGCSSLALTSLPSGLTSIGEDAFSGCGSLALTSLPSGLISIKSGAFSNCTSLALTSLPSGLTSIESHVFFYCGLLALTSLPSSLTTIGEQAFQGCTTLEGTLHEIPSSVTAIQYRAFYGVRFKNLKFLGLTPPTFGTQSIYALPQKVDCQVPSASLTEYQQAMTMLTGAGLITISTY